MAIAVGWPGRTAQLPAWQRPRRSPLAITACVAAFGLVVLLLYLYVPKATVVLYPQTTVLEDTIEVRADPGAIAVDPRGRRVPARVGYVVVDVLEQATTRGRLADPNARAIGSLTLVNRLGGSATVPSGSLVVSASGVKFTTTADATLGETSGSTTRVGIQAAEPGDRGNVGRLEINRLIGPLAGRIAVLNEEPTVGGGQGALPVISADDVDQIKRAATERARVDALNELRGDTQPDELLLADSLDAAVVEDSLDHGLGDQASVFTYRLKTRVSASRVARADLRQVALESWRPNVPAGFFAPDGQLTTSAPTTASVDRGTVVLRLPVRTVAVQQVDAATARDLARGRSAEDARREIARTMKLAAEPRVTLQPGWLGRAYRVDVALDLNPPKTP